MTWEKKKEDQIYKIDNLRYAIQMSTPIPELIMKLTEISPKRMNK